MDKKKILIIGHEPHIISAFIGFLSDEPYEVFTVPNGIEGLKILKKEKIDLAIAEMYIEELDGIHFMECVLREKIQTDILLRTRSESLDLSILKTETVSVFPIMKDKFLVKIKKDMSLPVWVSEDSWKILLESFLNENYSNSELKFENLMKHFRISRSYGCKLFKKYLGKTFLEKLREIRVEKAQQFLIGEPSLLIYEIAYKCGFRSSKRLHEAFIKIHGISPVLYKKKVNQD